MQIFKIMFCALFVGLMLLSCRKEFDVTPSNLTTNDIVGEWKITRYEDLDTKEDANPANHLMFGELFVTFSPTSASFGNASCGTQSFEYSLAGGHIRLTQNFIAINSCMDTGDSFHFYKVFRKPDNNPFINRNAATLTMISDNRKRKITMTKM